MKKEKKQKNSCTKWCRSEIDYIVVEEDDHLRMAL